MSDKDTMPENMWIEESPDDHTNTTAWKFEQRKFSTHPYLLKSTVDAQREADDKTIRALAEALRAISQISENTKDQRTFNLVRINRFSLHALSNNAPRIAEAQESRMEGGE